MLSGCAGRGGSIDFDEMIDGLALLAPEAIKEEPDSFFNVIDTEHLDEVSAHSIRCGISVIMPCQVSRLDLVRIFRALDRHPPKECFDDVSLIFEKLELSGNQCLDRKKFQHLCLKSPALRAIFVKYLAVEGNNEIRLATS